MDRFEDMAIFVAVAESQGFAAAARRLNLSPPSVTRAVASLESRIGTLLFTRNTRSVRLTESGQHFFADCRRILAEIAEAGDAAAGEDAVPRGNLTVTAPVLFGEMIITPIVVAFLADHAQMRIRLQLLDRVVNMIDEGMDVAIRIAPVTDPALLAIPVGHVRRVVCASPALLEQHGIPAHPDALKDFRLVDASSVGDWQFQDQGKRFTVPVQSALQVNSNRAAIRAACAGWGITRVISYQIANELATNVLKTVLSEFELPPAPVHVVYPEARRGSAKLRRFVDYCVDRLRANPALN
ncbi:LysR family transcriptional regulator [Permianibacter sp. IMCC34836]|uniref:LysR family transcriptional regulator n=1 Tax=Permianibacter fluminis TaxID=2738515 RepID=UPI0015569BF9|nr:LysR family transcriptional regulator [Permianibacter fluminis]NQD38004.1 LysR family transcriptional regulator [Permianibacter fluminis]